MTSMTFLLRSDLETLKNFEVRMRERNVNYLQNCVRNNN